MRYLISLLFCLCLSIQAAPFGPAQVAGWRPSLLNGLVAYWPLDEASGTRYDVWGTNHLTDVNSVPSGAALISKGAKNNATAGKRLVAASATFAAAETTNNFSVSAWVNFSTVNDESQLIVSKYNYSTSRRSWSIYLLYSKIRWIISTNGTEAITNIAQSTNATAGKWYHVVGMMSNNVASLWLDGVQVSSLSLNSALLYNTSDAFCLMAQIDDLLMANGIVDEVGLWSRVLSPGEIKQLYNIGRGRRFPFNSGP